VQGNKAFCNISVWQKHLSFEPVNNSIVLYLRLFSNIGYNKPMQYIYAKS